MNNYKIIKQISNDEYLLELNNKYIISYYVSQDYIHIENIDSIPYEEIEKVHECFESLKETILKDISTDEIDFDELDNIDFTKIEGYYDDDYVDYEDYIREQLDKVNTSTYVDTYSPGDDFETDWFNSLE